MPASNRLIPYVINHDEVDQIIKIPMTLVQSAHNYKDIIRERNGYQFKSCEFVFEQEWVWVAMAKIMRQLVVN